jgi:hypothetical protein
MDRFVRNTRVRDRIIWWEVQKLEHRQMQEAARAARRDVTLRLLDGIPPRA